MAEVGKVGIARRKLKMLLSRAKKIQVKTWILVLLLVPLGFVDATLLRLDHIRMTELRDAVLSADAEVTDEETETQAKEKDLKIAEALSELKEFVFSHIVINIIEENGVQKVTFGTGPFYLEHQYHRAANLALNNAEKKLTGDGNPYGNVYGEAGEVCRAEAIASGWTWDSSEFINCMLTEIQKYPAASEIQDTIIASLPSTELFRHNYASPVWAPTPAGFVLIITFIIMLIIVIRLGYRLFLRIALIFV